MVLMCEWEQRDVMEPIPLTFEGLRKLQADILQVQADEMQQQYQDYRRLKQEGKSVLVSAGGVLGGDPPSR